MLKVEYKIANPDGSISDKQLLINKNNVLGKGSYGIVYKASLDGYGYVAAKFLNFGKKNMIEMIYSECSVAVTDLVHSIMIKRLIYNPDDHDIFSNEVMQEATKNKNINLSAPSPDCPASGIIAIYDFVDGDDLKNAITQHRNLTLSFSTEVIMHYIGCLLRGLLEMVQAAIAHRDIKPANIMIQRGDVKYIDFGLSCQYDKCPKKLQGTPKYIPSQMWEDNFDNYQEGDIYALGLTFAGLFFNELELIKEAEPGTSNAEHITAILRKNLLDEPMVQLLSGMLAKNVKDRLTAAEALDMYNHM